MHFNRLDVEPDLSNAVPGRLPDAFSPRHVSLTVEFCILFNSHHQLILLCFSQDPELVVRTAAGTTRTRRRERAEDDQSSCQDQFDPNHDDFFVFHLKKVRTLLM